MKKLQVLGLISSLVLATGLVGCKQQEETVETEPYDYKPVAESVGSEFWTNQKSQNVPVMANLSSEDKRDDFISKAEAYFNNKYDWEHEFFDNYLSSVQVIQGQYMAYEDKASIDYTLIISDYENPESGGLLSYKVRLDFELVEEDAYVSNPEEAIDAYKDILNDYQRYLINTKVFPKETEPEETETTPTETTVETTVETTMATETTPIETVPADTTPSDTAAETTPEDTTATSESETSETTKKKKKKKKEVVVSDDENEPGEY